MNEIVGHNNIKMENIAMRPIEARDVHCLAHFFLSNDSPEITKNFNPFLLSLETAEFIACDKHCDKYYAVFHDDAIIGFAMLRGWDDGYEIPSLGILIDQNHHGQGIGGHLLQYVIGEACRIPVDAIRLTVNSDNQIARSFYNKFGFVVTSQQTASVAGIPTVKDIMMLHLTEPQPRVV